MKTIQQALTDAATATAALGEALKQLQSAAAALTAAFGDVGELIDDTGHSIGTTGGAPIITDTK